MEDAGMETYDDGARQFGELVVGVGSDDDVPGVAEMHRLQIAEGFLPTLGRRFLQRLYHRIVHSPYGFLIVAHDDAQALVGFVAGTINMSRLYRQFLVRDGVIVAVTSGVRLARSVPKVIETLRYGRAGGGTTEPELLAIAVEETWHRCGVGTTLVEAFLRRASTSDASVARVVVGAGNTAAIELYRRAGFESASDLEVHRGSASRIMRTNLPRCTVR